MAKNKEISWHAWGDSNARPTDPESVALWFWSPGKNPIFRVKSFSFT